MLEQIFYGLAIVYFSVALLFWVGLIVFLLALHRKIKVMKMEIEEKMSPINQIVNFIRRNQKASSIGGAILTGAILSLLNRIGKSR